MKKIRITHDMSIETPNQGWTYMNCAECLKERPKTISPKDWARQQVAFTRDGIQVWCTRHDVNIDHMTITVVPK